MFSSWLLKKALPFTLTLLFGATLGHLFNSSPAPRETKGVLTVRARDVYGCRSSRRWRARTQQAQASVPVPIFEPNTRYTKEAWQRQVTGVVRLRLTVGRDGSVQNVEVLEGLPYGLTEEAAKVARQSRFIPASDDDGPVVATKDVEYIFSLSDRMAAGL